MNEFRKKQKLLKKVMNVVCIITAIMVFVYIGIRPMLNGIPNLIIGYVCDILVVVALVVLFVYYSKYGKSDKFLESIEDELEDTGYYFTSRTENNVADYTKAVKEDLIKHGFKMEADVDVDGLIFDYRAVKGYDCIYVVSVDELDKNDVIAYQDAALYDYTSVVIKRKGNVVVMFICDKADDGSISLSKMISPYGRKEQIKFANAIVEISSSRCYFLGNKPTKLQQLIANYAMNCETPIKEQYIGKEKLQFQFDLEEHMKDFNIKDFKNGDFYAH